MRFIGFFVSLMVSANLFAVPNADSIARESTTIKGVEAKLEKKKGQVEGMMIFHSVAGGSSPMIGGSIGYDIFTNINLGFRVLMPTKTSDDLNIYSTQIFGRYTFMNRITKMYLEGNLSANLYGGNGQGTFYTGGGGLGITHPVSEGFAFGGLAGVELSNYKVTERSASYTESTFIYPKIALSGQFRF